MRMIFTALLISFGILFGMAQSDKVIDETQQKISKAIESGDDAGAFQMMMTLAEKGDASAMYAVGIWYRDGKGVAKNDEMAFHWMKKAAEENNYIAMRTLSDMYLQGIGTEKSEFKAHKWLSKAEKIKKDSDQ